MAFNNLRKHFETSDRAQDLSLRTHYYRNDYRKVKTALTEAAKAAGFEFSHENDERMEHVLKRKDCEVIVTIITITPIETTVDFTVNTFGLLSFGKGRKVIEELYRELDKRLMLK